MNCFIKKIKFFIHASFFLPVSLLIIQFFLLSCSNVAPELEQSDYSVIFDYKNENIPPDVRLAIFMESKSDVRRFSRIRIKSLETGFIWDFDNIEMVLESDGGSQWAGNTNLKAPENEVIPNGKYEVTYYNADEKYVSSSIEVEYDTSFYDIKATEIEKIMKENGGILKIAIYNKEKLMIYFGEKTEEFQTDISIKNAYVDADYYKDVWNSKNSNVIFIMPEIKVMPEIKPADD